MRDGAKLSMARHMRRNETLAERRLWEQLRNRQFQGAVFVRQAPVGRYIADFVCRDAQLIVEVEGATHSTDAEIAGDTCRSEHLAALGYSAMGPRPLPLRGRGHCRFAR